MPELPEVETLRRGLERCLVNQTIVAVEIANAKVLKGQSETVLRERCIGRQIERVGRRGKYLLLKLSTPNPSANSDDAVSSLTLCIHLKMRGQLRLQKKSDPVASYYCVGIELESGDWFRFYDMWTWGEIRALTDTELAAVAGLKGMGEEPLEAGWNAEALAAKLRGKRTAIKPTLLDQTIVAGVGNIYADESLFRAKIHPQRTAGSLTDAEIERLVDAIQSILTAACDSGGTTSEEFTDLAGDAGRFVPLVYDRGGKPCPNCENILTRIRLGGRGTVYCSVCQL